MKKFNELYQFEVEIYPLILWIMRNPTIEFLNKRFNGICDKNGNITDHFDSDDIDKPSASASTYPVISEHGYVGNLIILRSKNKYILENNTYIHESRHVCDFWCERLGVYTNGFDEGEASAYLQTWIASCIKKVALNKAESYKITDYGNDSKNG